MDSNHTIKKIGDRYRVFVNLGNGMRFLIHGSYDTEEAAETAYTTWLADDKDKRDYWAQAQPFEGTWG